jgi:exopolysaccharide biosynthesis protein
VIQNWKSLFQLVKELHIQKQVFLLHKDGEVFVADDETPESVAFDQSGER